MWCLRCEKIFEKPLTIPKALVLLYYKNKTFPNLFATLMTAGDACVLALEVLFTTQSCWSYKKKKNHGQIQKQSRMSPQEKMEVVLVVVPWRRCLRAFQRTLTSKSLSSMRRAMGELISILDDKERKENRGSWTHNITKPRTNVRSYTSYQCMGSKTKHVSLGVVWCARVYSPL